MSNEKNKETLTPEEASKWSQQLKVARTLLEKTGAKISAIQEKFFDAHKDAFEIKLRDMLKEVLDKHVTDEDAKNKIVDEFVVSFEENVLAMTPFYQRKEKK